MQRQSKCFLDHAKRELLKKCCSLAKQIKTDQDAVPIKGVEGRVSRSTRNPIPSAASRPASGRSVFLLSQVRRR